MNRTASPATSARAFAEAKHRHIATVNSRLPTEYVEPIAAPPKLEKLRSHAELSLRKEYHKYVPHEVNSARSGHTHAPIASTDALAFSPSSRVILATGDVLQSPQERGEVFNSHRAFTAAKSRHYTPHRARGREGMSTVLAAGATVTRNSSQRRECQHAADTYDYLGAVPVAAKRVESGGMHSDASRCTDDKATRTASQNGRGTPRKATESYTRTSTPDARIPNQPPRGMALSTHAQQPVYGTTSHHLSYGNHHTRAAGSPSRTGSRGAGRRVYTMPRLHTNIIC